MRKGLAGLTALLLCSCGAPQTPPAPTDGELQDQARLSLASNPHIGPVWARLEVSFPEETQRLLDETMVAYRRGATQEEANQMGRSFIDNLVSTNAVHAQKADIIPLRAVAASTAALLGALEAERPQACADYVLSGRIAPEHRQGLSDASEQQMTKVAVATLEAIAFGRSEPHEHGEATQADYQSVIALYEEIGGVRSDLFALFGESPQAMDPAVACHAGQLWWSAVSSAPDDIAGRYISDVMGPPD